MVTVGSQALLGDTEGAHSLKGKTCDHVREVVTLQLDFRRRVGVYQVEKWEKGLPGRGKSKGKDMRHEGVWMLVEHKAQDRST